MIKDLFEKLAVVEKSVRERMVSEFIAHSPIDEALSQAVLVLETGEKRYWESALTVIKCIGYPRNKGAIPALIDLMSDLNSPGAYQSIDVLQAMDEKEVLQYLIKAILSPQDRDHFWGSRIEGICTSIARQDINRNLAVGSMPALASLFFIEQTYKVVDISFIFDVFIRVGPSCASYILPGLVQALQLVKDETVKRQIYTLINSFDKDVVQLYEMIM